MILSEDSFLNYQNHFSKETKAALDESFTFSFDSLAIFYRSTNIL
jgi:hypothetical protein